MSAIEHHAVLDTARWLGRNGFRVTEVRVDAPIKGSLHVTFDITSFADGTSRTDVQFNNDYAMQAVGGEVKYDATIKQNGTTVLQQSNIDQFQYQTWHKQIWSNGAPQVNIQHDIAALEKTGAIQNYDLSLPVDPGLIANEATEMTSAGWGGVLAVNGVTQYMPATGGRAGAQPTPCDHCGGTGSVWRDTGAITAEACPACRGAGQRVSEPCPDCRGRGVRAVRATVPVLIPAGVDTGAQIRVPGEGHAGPFGGPRGDLVVIARVHEDPGFARKGDNPGP